MQEASRTPLVWSKAHETAAALVTATPTVLFALDADGKFTRAEGRGLLPLGLRPQAVIGRSVFEVYAGISWLRDALKRALAGEPLVCLGALGGQWHVVHCSPLHGPEGSDAGVAGIFTPLPPTFLEGLDVIVWMVDAISHRVLFVGGQGLCGLGLPPSAWYESEDFLLSRIPPRERDLLREALDDVREPGRDRTSVHRLIAADGSERWFQTALRGLPGSDGRIREVVGVMLDITARKMDEPLLYPAETWFRLALEQIPAIVYTINPELRFTGGVGAGLASLGIPEDRVLGGITLYDYFHTRDPEDPVIVAHRKALAGEHAAMETTWMGRTFQTHVEPFRDAEGHIVGAVGVALDITERKRAEEEGARLLETERTARAATEEALELREEFLSIASHEIATPLTSLQLALQTIERAVDRGEPPPPGTLPLAVRQTRRLSRLIDELLNLSRIDAHRLTPHREPVDLVALARGVVETFSEEAARAKSPVKVHADAPVVARVDRTQLEQVLTNLLSNALKYGAGKPVDIHVEAVSRAGHRNARIVVADRGIGIEPDRMAKIFGRFERAVSSRHYGGLGLGLYISRHIVEAHDGTIRLASSPGVGTRAVVELPLGTPGAAADTS